MKLTPAEHKKCELLSRELAKQDPDAKLLIEIIKYFDDRNIRFGRKTAYFKAKKYLKTIILY